MSQTLLRLFRSMPQLVPTVLSCTVRFFAALVYLHKGCIEKAAPLLASIGSDEGMSPRLRRVLSVSRSLRVPFLSLCVCVPACLSVCISVRVE